MIDTLQLNYFEDILLFKMLNIFLCRHQNYTEKLCLKNNNKKKKLASLCIRETVKNYRNGWSVVWLKGRF